MNGKKFILMRTDQRGGYVANLGRKSSYVTNPHHARKFDSREEAEANACGNEVVVEYAVM